MEIIEWIGYQLIHLEEYLKIIYKKSGHPIGKGNMSIGNDVWITNNVLILPGVNVGNGAIIWAGSVVTNNVDNYEIVAGNPAKHIRYRFDNDTINVLERIEWWNWPIDKIKDNIKFLQSPNIQEFLKNYDK